MPQDGTQLDFENEFSTPPYRYRFRLEDAVHKRNRTGAGLKLDYRVNPELTVFTSFMFNHYTDTVDQKRLAIQSAHADQLGDQRLALIRLDSLHEVGLALRAGLRATEASVESPFGSNQPVLSKLVGLLLVGTPRAATSAGAPGRSAP